MNVAVKTPSLFADKQHPLANVLLKSMGVDGVYARTAAYENVVEGLQRFISGQRPATAEIFRFPPVMSRKQLERSGYLKSFPHLLGCVHCLQGSEPEITAAVGRFDAGGTWTDSATAAETVLAPAACYPVYPIAADRGTVPAEGYAFDVASDCFRHEPSKELDRLQSFRMREYVRIGTPEQVEEFREEWLERAQNMTDTLGLAYAVERASDPFFGRVGQFMAANQVERALKFELLVPLRGDGSPTACMSFNYHKDHFGEVWGLAGSDGTLSHTGCVAFGIDRLAVALFSTHGYDSATWPQQVRGALGL